MGADVTYSCIGPNAYQVTLTLFRDCAGITPLTTQVLDYGSITCGVNASINLSQVGSGVDVTPLCPGQTSACSGGSSPFGIQQYLFTGTLTLPSGCADWELGWSNCCRNFAITTLNGPGNQATYVPARLDNSTTPCNNSPVFNNIPTPIVCVNQPVVYNHGVTDPDGDDLRFSLTNCLQDAGVPVSYGGGYSASTPLSTASGISIDSLTGELTFTPDQLQIGVICVLVEEYRNGLKIGETVRDMQVSVITCNNAPPVISGVNGDTANFSIDFCVGSEICFDFLISDPNGDVITSTWNGGITGGTLVFTGNGSTAPSARFCWQPTLADTGLSFFTVTATDDHCPVVGSATYAFSVNVSPAAGVINASPDQTICLGESVSLLASTTPVADSLRWTPAGSLSDPTLANPIASPLQTTNYVLTAYLPGGCQSQEQVLVSVDPLPALWLSPSIARICIGGSLALTAQAPSAISYLWNTGDSSSSLTVSPTTNTTYSVTITDSSGCSNSKDVLVAVVTPSLDLCNVVYVSPNGNGAGTQLDPTSLEVALLQATCTPLLIKMDEGTYVLDTPIQILPDGVTLEGGFQSANNWHKVSTPGATTIHRSAANPEGPANAQFLSAFDLNGAADFRLQDLTITTEHATPLGMSTYGLHLSNCSGYDIVRCRILPGDAADGVAGMAGHDGTHGAAGANGEDGAENNQDLAGEGGKGGMGAGADGGVGGPPGLDLTPTCCAAGDFGENGASSTTTRSGGGGGGGAAGGERDNYGGNGGRGGGISNAPSNGGNGGTGGADGGACFGGNTTGLPGSPGLVGTDGNNGMDAGPGPNGLHLNGYWTPGGPANDGADGYGGLGGGGGGGGGGERCTCCINGAGSGGGGGGGGGEGGTGGTGGTGGGSSFALYLYNNGPGGNLSSSFLTPGHAGTGGIGGMGGNGGVGGGGGQGSDYGNASGINVGSGGNGGNGGDGGDGGAGGAGADGQALAVYQSGGTSLPLTTQDTAFDLVAQSSLTMQNVSCVNVNCTFTTPALSSWDMGPLADPPSPLTGSSVTVSYQATGRHDILLNGQLYEDFVFIQSSANPVPEAATSAPMVNGYYRICVGNDASFTAVNGASGFEYRWDLDSAAATWIYDRSIYQTLSSVGFMTADTFDILLQYRSDCCGLSVADTLPFIVEASPDLVITGPGTLCAGQGPVTLSASGGASYQWTPATGLSSDTAATVQAYPGSSTTYQLTAYNASGFCADQTSYPLTINDLLLSPSTTPAGCLPNGSAAVVVGNGSSFYQYLWSNGSTNATLNNLAAGSYGVRVTDILTGCQDSVVTQVPQTPGSLSGYVANSARTSCAGTHDGSATVAASGATGTVSYAWSNGATTASIGPVAAGSYTAVITDQGGCQTSVTATIPAAPTIVPAIQSQTVPDCDQFATALVSASGGQGPYQFLWSTNPAQSGAIADSLSAGTYQVTVTDQANCSTNLAVNIPGPASPVILAVDTIQQASTCVASDGSATVIALGNGGVSYAWEINPPQTGPTLSNVIPGAYLVIATGAGGCADTLGLEIGPNCPLLQGLLAFEVLARPDHLRLNWEVEHFSEQDAPYVIQRSQDGLNFVSLPMEGMTVTRVGQLGRFSYRDEEVVADQWFYYRLMQYQRDGLTTYSEIKRGKIVLSEQFSVVNFFPVPAQEVLYVTVSIPHPSPLRFELFNAQGQLVKQKTLVLTAGITKLTVEMKDEAEGIYFLQLHTSSYGTRRLSFLKK
jgi:hypothetical protein